MDLRIIKMNILILRDQTIRLGKQVYCGDRCCSHMVYENYEAKKGETFDSYNVDTIYMTEGKDFNYDIEE
jgi:hypothetical protein